MRYVTLLYIQSRTLLFTLNRHAEGYRCLRWPLTGVLGPASPSLTNKKPENRAHLSVAQVSPAEQVSSSPTIRACLKRELLKHG